MYMNISKQHSPIKTIISASPAANSTFTRVNYNEGIGGA